MPRKYIWPPEKRKAAYDRWAGKVAERGLTNMQLKDLRKSCVDNGVTLEEYWIQFDKQEGKCLGCETVQSKLEHRLCIDHDHNTGRFRGLLCRECNLVLGNSKDSIQVLKNLIQYLEESI